MKYGKLKISCEDCMDLMKRYDDNHFELAIIDCPYGIGADKMTLGNGKRKIYRGNNWDNKPPSKEYFNELFRVSKNQILWGANHYIEQFCKNSSCWIFWDKNNGESLFADGELAWTSFKSPVRIAKIHWCGSSAKWESGLNKIHPTQKPVELYKWLLKNYAKEGDKILDTHMGSGSSAIACHYMGYDLTACELDKEYYEQAMQRIEEQTRQEVLI